MCVNLSSLAVRRLTVYETLFNQMARKSNVLHYLLTEVRTSSKAK